MAVNLVAPAADSLLPIDGVDLGWAEAGVRKANRKDVLLVRIAAVSYTHLTLPTSSERCRSRWSPYH